MEYLLGIDVGTSGTKSAVFTSDGTLVAEATASYPLYQPENGWAEQDPNDWWRAVCETLRAVTEQVPAHRICAVGLSGQMHGTVMLDEQGDVIGRAIIWCDGRTGEECREIESRVGRERLILRTGCPAITGFTAESLLWLRKHEPERYARCRRVLVPKDYVRYRLTGALAMDASDASGTQLLDTGRRVWSEEVAEALDLPLSFFPRVCESAELVGTVTAEAARLTGLACGTPVAGGAADNAAAAVGCGVARPGTAFVTIGTSGVICAETARPLLNERGSVQTFCSAVPNEWHAMGSTQASGLSMSWFRRNFAPTLSYAELDALAREVPIGAERLLYFPALMGELNPVFDPNARGAFVGLSALHGTGHLARAVMEGVVYSIYSNFLEFHTLGAEIDKMVLCGGGAKSRLWREILADVCNVPISLTASAECAVLGAAILAGTAVGVYASIPEGSDRAVRERDVILPDGAAHARYERVYGVFRELHGNLKSTFAALKSI